MMEKSQPLKPLRSLLATLGPEALKICCQAFLVKFSQAALMQIGQTVVKDM